MVTPNNTLRRARFPKIARRPCSALRGLDLSPDPPVPVSEGGASRSEASEIDFAELKDGTLVDLVTDPAKPGRTCLADVE